MSTIEKRTALIHQLIEQADEAFIEAAHLLLTGQYLADENPVVSYDIDGTPRTSSEFTAILDEEVAAAKKGEYITIEEFKAQSAQWSQTTK